MRFLMLSVILGLFSILGCKEETVSPSVDYLVIKDSVGFIQDTNDPEGSLYIAELRNDKIKKEHLDKGTVFVYARQKPGSGAGKLITTNNDNEYYALPTMVGTQTAIRVLLYEDKVQLQVQKITAKPDSFFVKLLILKK
ncbi:MAG: hypothetical protein U0Y96_02660 [Candidatus Kapaibacterium sp.]